MTATIFSSLQVPTPRGVPGRSPRSVAIFGIRSHLGPIAPAKPSGLAAARSALRRLQAPADLRQGRRGASGAFKVHAADIQAYVWGAPDNKDRPWACPFCHSLLLIVNEKTLPYDRQYVDFKNKPDWFAKENPQGKMPLIKDESTGKFVGGLEGIVNYLEDKYVEPSIGKLSKDSSPSTLPETDIQGLWQAYINFAHATAADNDADDARAPFEKKLSHVANTLKENGGEFFGKDYADVTDLVLGPQLNHIVVVLKHLHKEWVFPSESSILEGYLKSIRDLPSWKLSQYSDSDVIEYWETVIKPSK